MLTEYELGCLTQSLRGHDEQLPVQMQQQELVNDVPEYFQVAPELMTMEMELGMGMGMEMGMGMGASGYHHGDSVAEWIAATPVCDLLQVNGTIPGTS